MTDGGLVLHAPAPAGLHMLFHSHRINTTSTELLTKAYADRHWDLQRDMLWSDIEMLLQVQPIPATKLDFPEVFPEVLCSMEDDDAPMVPLQTYTAMMARRVEAQVRWDWDLAPSLQSLSFASQVNLAVSLSYYRALRKLEDAHEAYADWPRDETPL